MSEARKPPKPGSDPSAPPAAPGSRPEGANGLLGASPALLETARKIQALMRQDQPVKAKPIAKSSRKPPSQPRPRESRPPVPTKAAIRAALKRAFAGKPAPGDEEILLRTHEAMAKERKLLDLREVMNATDKQELIYQAQAMVLCGLPYQQPRDERGNLLRDWVRKAKTSKGELEVRLVALDPELGLLFGKDRALVAFAVTKALQQGSPTITWDTAMEFFETFGVDRRQAGGYQYRWLVDAFKRLGSTAIYIRWAGYEDWGKARLLVEDWRLPSSRDLAHESSGQVRLPMDAPYAVELGAKFWAELQEGRVVPFRLEVMRQFSDEPKAWDFAGFVCYRSKLCEVARGYGKSGVARIPKSQLLEALGSTDQDTYRLVASLKEVLERLKAVWPECQARFERGGTLVVEPPLNGIHLVRPRQRQQSLSAPEEN